MRMVKSPESKPWMPLFSRLLRSRCRATSNPSVCAAGLRWRFQLNGPPVTDEENVSE